MKNLYLLRHAKASWGKPGTGDFERPLEERGIEAARLMGHFMASSDMRPDFVLCSAAARAQQTFSCFLDGYGESLESRIEETLYLADPGIIAGHLGSLPDHIKSVLVVAHNPGLQCLALDLSTGANEDRQRLTEKFPTAALAALNCDQPGWSPVNKGTFTLQGYFTPKRLQVKII
ncbi:MAG: histidine phosphatase family protein [Rhodospirillales bacterium]|nr:histidine phosphatase family protein [Rhodospirillales bacterium]